MPVKVGHRRRPEEEEGVLHNGSELLGPGGAHSGGKRGDGVPEAIGAIERPA